MEHSERVWQAAVAIYPTLLSQAINLGLRFPKEGAKLEELRLGLEDSALRHAIALVGAFEKLGGGA